MERCISIPYGKSTLHGIIHLPEANSVQHGVLIINGGLNVRSGPQRSYVDIARRLCKKGCTVLRVDLPGTGLCEGDWKAGVTLEFWHEIQMGCYVSPILQCADHLIKNHNLKSFSLIGLCGGAVTALLVSTILPKLSCMVLWGTPGILEGFSNKENSIHKQNEIFLFMNKIFNKNIYALLLSAKNEKKYIIGKILKNLKKEQLSNSPSFEKNNLYQKKIIDSLTLAIKRHCAILIIYGKKDAYLYQFKNLLKNENLFDNNDFLNLIKWVEVEHGDHLLSLSKNKITLINYIDEFISNFRQFDSKDVQAKLRHFILPQWSLLKKHIDRNN